MMKIKVESNQMALQDILTPIEVNTFFEETMQFISQIERFKVADVPGKMSRNSKLALIRRLVEQRYLRIVQSADGGAEATI